MALLVMVSLSMAARKKRPATVIITAGQSNTDGRVMNSDLPDYIKKNGYKHCSWCYGTSGECVTGWGGFLPFWPQMGHKSTPGEKWAYDAVTYYLLDKKLKEDFYVVKWSLGGTAIDTTCRSAKGMYWSADSAWLSRNKSTINGGKSLLKSFTEEIAACIDGKLGKLPEGFEVKAMLWHQGESDMKAGTRYYDNLKAVVAHVRRFLAEKTGNEKYLSLPFICGTVSRRNKQYSKEVEAALYRLAAEDDNFYVIDMSTGELQRDQLHFTAKSAEHLGRQMYKRIMKLAK